MQIISSNSLLFGVRQSAIAQLKIVINNTWATSLSFDQKNLVKSQIFEAIIQVSQHRKLCSMYENIVEIIAENDFPENWSSIIQSIVEKMLSTSDLDEFYCALMILKSILKKYEFQFGQSRVPLF